MFKTSIIIDFETTGVSKLSEVISISYGIKEDEIKTRYYFPLDKSSVSYYYAIKVNGLTDKEIAKRRDSQNATYPKFYKDDAELHKILNSYETFIAHNINFDKNFLQFDITNKNLLCTMQESKSIVNSTDKNGKLKNPKLSECCNYYNIRFSDTQAHNSEYDVLKTIQLAKEVFEYDVEFEKKEIILYTKFTTLPLLVDYSQKDDAKAKGAIWSSKYKIWNFPVSKAKDNDIFQLQKYFPTYYVNTLSIETGECECYNCKKLTPIIRLCSNNSTEFEIGENDNELTIDIEEYYIFEDEEVRTDFYAGDELIAKGNTYTRKYITYLSYIKKLDENLIKKINQKYPNYKLTYSKTTKSKYYANHCIHCNRFQGDNFINTDNHGRAFYDTEKKEIISKNKMIPVIADVSLSAYEI